MRRLRAVRAQDRERGVTLAELLVSMTILTIFLAVFSSIAVELLDSVRSQQSRSDNLDSTRTLVQELDRQVRYANAVNPPVTVAGSRYVTWRSGSVNGFGLPSGVQSCVQWRVSSTGLVQNRSWDPAATPVFASAWETVGNGVGPVGAAEIFSISATTPGQNRQQLALSFQTTHGSQPVATRTAVTFTALNTRTSSAPATAVCQEVAPT